MAVIKGVWISGYPLIVRLFAIAVRKEPPCLSVWILELFAIGLW